MYEYYDAVLHAVTEGLLSPTSRAASGSPTTRPSACSACPRTPRADRSPSSAWPSPSWRPSPTTSRARTSCTSPSARVLVLTRPRRCWHGRRLGFVATLRDRTDLEDLTGELDSARGLTEALRSQAHESANRLHTIVSLIELGHTDRALASPPTSCRSRSCSPTASSARSTSRPSPRCCSARRPRPHERGIDFEIEPGAALAAGRRARARRRDHRRQPHRQRPRRRGLGRTPAPRAARALRRPGRGRRMPSSRSPTTARVCRRARSSDAFRRG